MWSWPIPTMLLLSACRSALPALPLPRCPPGGSSLQGRSAPAVWDITEGHSACRYCFYKAILLSQTCIVAVGSCLWAPTAVAARTAPGQPSPPLFGCCSCSLPSCPVFCQSFRSPGANRARCAHTAAHQVSHCRQAAATAPASATNTAAVYWAIEVHHNQPPPLCLPNGFPNLPKGLLCSAHNFCQVLKGLLLPPVEVPWAGSPCSWRWKLGGFCLASWPPRFTMCRAEVALRGMQFGLHTVSLAFLRVFPTLTLAMEATSAR